MFVDATLSLSSSHIRKYRFRWKTQGSRIDRDCHSPSPAGHGDKFLQVIEISSNSPNLDIGKFFVAVACTDIPNKNFVMGLFLSINSGLYSGLLFCFDCRHFELFLRQPCCYEKAGQCFLKCQWRWTIRTELESSWSVRRM